MREAPRPHRQRRRSRYQPVQAREPGRNPLPRQTTSWSGRTRRSCACAQRMTQDPESSRVSLRERKTSSPLQPKPRRLRQEERHPLLKCVLCKVLLSADLNKIEIASRSRRVPYCWPWSLNQLRVEHRYKERQTQNVSVRQSPCIQLKASKNCISPQ